MTVTQARSRQMKPPFSSQIALRTLYPKPCPLSVAHLSHAEIRLYTSILSNQPPAIHYGTKSDPTALAILTRRYKTRTTDLISQLPGHLVNPTPLHILPQAQTVKLFHAVGADSSLPPAAKLCTLHKKLNAQVIASAIGMIEGEIEDHMDDFTKRGMSRERQEAKERQEVNKLGQFTPSSTAEEARRLCSAAASVLAPTIPADEYKHFFHHPPPKSWRAASPVYSPRCSACILARVGSSVDILTALRACLLSRLGDVASSGKKRCLQLEWIESWIESLGDKSLEVLLRSGRLAAWAREHIIADELRPRPTPKTKPAPSATTLEALPMVRKESTRASSQALPEPLLSQHLEKENERGWWDMVFTPSCSTTVTSSLCTSTVITSSLTATATRVKSIPADSNTPDPSAALSTQTISDHASSNTAPSSSEQQIPVATPATSSPSQSWPRQPLFARTSVQSSRYSRRPVSCLHEAQEHASSPSATSTSPTSDVRRDERGPATRTRVKIPYPVGVLMASLRTESSVSSSTASCSEIGIETGSKSSRRVRVWHPSLLPPPLHPQHSARSSDAAENSSITALPRLTRERERRRDRRRCGVTGPPKVNYGSKPVLSRD